MTDKELLEQAANAAGYKHTQWTPLLHPKVDWGVCTVDGIWNPLTDDGDALRLAARLCIEIEHNNPLDTGRYVRAYRCGIISLRNPVSALEEFDDEYQRTGATRRAIVRAAAEIGKGMK